MPKQNIMQRLAKSLEDMMHKVSRGISLIELLIYIAIFSGLMVVLFTVFITFTKDRGQIDARTEVQQSMRFSMENMAQAVHRATGVNEPAAATSPSMSLAMSDGAKNPTVFSVSSGILNMREGTGATEPLNSALTTVGSLTFTRIVNSPTTGTTQVSVKIDLALQYKNNAKPHLQYTQQVITTAAIKQ